MAAVGCVFVWGWCVELTEPQARGKKEAMRERAGLARAALCSHSHSSFAGSARARLAPRPEAPPHTPPLVDPPTNMPLFHRGPAGPPSSSRGFAASPLSPGVPLDGTDTVPGLRQLARAAELDRASRLLDAAGRNGVKIGGRERERRGKGDSPPSHRSLNLSPFSLSIFSSKASPPAAATPGTRALTWRACARPTWLTRLAPGPSFGGGGRWAATVTAPPARGPPRPRPCTRPGRAPSRWTPPGSGARRTWCTS